MDDCGQASPEQFNILYGANEPKRFSIYELPDECKNIHLESDLNGKNGILLG